MHIFIHLLNDLSGSPRVLNQKLRCYQEAGEDCLVITNTTGGFIDLATVQHHLVGYRKGGNRLLWAGRLLLWHCRVFMLVLRLAKPGDYVHANTLLTAVQLLPAKLKRATTIIHVHELRVSSRVFRALTFRVIHIAADRIVYVSRYVRDQMQLLLPARPSTVTYPCVDLTIAAAATVAVPRADDRRFVVGLICSLTWYKGYRRFVELAAAIPQCDFLLVLNGDPGRFDAEVPLSDRSPNLRVEFNLADVTTALRAMDLLLSLTDRRGWIETFGLTLIEAMTFGLPVIAPNIGAPAEYIEAGVNGFTVDEADVAQLIERIQLIASDRGLYARLSRGARSTAARFSPATYCSATSSERQFISGTFHND